MKSDCGASAPGFFRVSSRNFDVDLQRGDEELGTILPAVPAPVAFVIPAYNAAKTVSQVVQDVATAWGDRSPAPIIVVDDGSTDGTGERAQNAGARVVSLGRNSGKGAALIAGFAEAVKLGAGSVITLDADGQHFGKDAVALALCEGPREALVLGIRDMRRADAPLANQRSNKISNFFLGFFSRGPLADSQCGLRRYPVPETLDLGLRDARFGLESEVILRARYRHWQLLEVPVQVHYPPPDERVTHFRNVRDPIRIVARVVTTLVLLRLGK